MRNLTNSTSGNTMLMMVGNCFPLLQWNVIDFWFLIMTVTPLGYQGEKNTSSLESGNWLMWLWQEINKLWLSVNRKLWDSQKFVYSQEKTSSSVCKHQWLLWTKAPLLETTESPRCFTNEPLNRVFLSGLVWWKDDESKWQKFLVLPC